MSKTVANYTDVIEIVTLDTPCIDIVKLMIDKNIRVVVVCGVLHQSHFIKWWQDEVMKTMDS